MQKIIFFTFLSFFSLYIYAQRAPVWLESTKTIYPPNAYESAIGEGNSRIEAENAAYANLSRVFGVSVELDSRAQTRYLEAETALKTQKNLDLKTNISSKHNLLNVSIAHTFFDQNHNKFYVLALMPRTETMQMLLQAKKELEDVCAIYLAQAEDETDPLYKFSLIDMAAILAAKNETITNQYNVLASVIQTLPVTPVYNYRELTARGKSIARSITFGVKTNDKVPLAQAAVEKTLTNLGMRLNQKNPTYMFSERFTYEAANSYYSMYIISYTFQLDLTDINGTIIKTFTYTGRDGGTNETDALRVVRNRLIREINEGNKKENIEAFFIQFSRFLDSILVQTVS